MWSKKLQDLTRMLIKDGGMVFMKSFDGDAGMLFPNNQKKIYTISLISVWCCP